jgi:hypothetical protein
MMTFASHSICYLFYDEGAAAVSEKRPKEYVVVNKEEKKSNDGRPTGAFPGNIKRRQDLLISFQ